MNRGHGRRPTDLRRPALGLLLALALALAVMPVAGGAATANRAIQADDEASYTDTTFGWTIEWDPAVWVQFNETDGGVGFDGWQVDAGTVLITNETAYGDDTAACLAAETPPFDPSGLLDNPLVPPATPADAASGFYLFTFDGTENSSVYVECRPLVEGEALLSILWVLEDSTGYDAALPLYEQLVASLDVSEAHPEGEGPDVDDEETSQGDGETETFTDPTHGWSIAWDPATWGGASLDDLSTTDWAGNAFEATGIQFRGNDLDALGQVNIIGLTIYGDDAAACQEAWMLGEAQGVSASEADLDLPSAPADAEQGLQLISGGPTEGMNYVECRPLVEGEAVLLVNWQLMDAAGYEEALPVFEELLVGLDLGGDQSAGEDTGDGDNEAADEEASEDGTEFFTDPIYGWSIAWDPEQWEAEGPIPTVGENDVPGTQMDFLGRDYEGMGYVRIGSVPTTSVDPAGCVELFRPKTSDELVGDGAAVDNLREPDLPLPAAPSDAVGRLFQYAPGDQITYLECRTLVPGEAVLLIDWYLPEASRYEGALPAFDALIAGLDMGEDGSAEDAGDEPADEEPADEDLADDSADAPADVGVLEAELEEVGGSGVSGLAVVSDEPDGLAVTIEMDDDGFAAGQKPYVHAGTCDDYDPESIFSLQAIDEAGRSETRNIAVAFADLAEAPHAIVLHPSRTERETVVACGELAA